MRLFLLSMVTEAAWRHTQKAGTANDTNGHEESLKQAELAALQGKQLFFDGQAAAVPC
jgi:hypothetical protein